MSEKCETTSKEHKTSVDKDVRLRILKEKQNEERQRKLEEIRAQAFAAQRFKEQKEQERRQRLEEMRIKEEIRRQQVEERKRAINDAERDRLESILRRNQQRENRLESKKRNERSSLVFAFGSSTPRNLDPNDLSSSFWGHRRATSTQNITSSSSSFNRRGTERDVENGSKKRATSAGGLERAGESSLPTTPAGCASGYLGRRRTDLMPTIPSRDSLSSASRKSLSHSPASSRPSSSMSHQSTTSVTSSVSVRHRPSSGPRKPRPSSIAITGISGNSEKKTETTKPPLPKRKSITKSTEKVSKSKPSTGDTTPKLPASPTATELGSVTEGDLNGDVGDPHKKPPDTVQVPEAQQPIEVPDKQPTQEVATENLLDLTVENVQNELPAQRSETDSKASNSVEDDSEKSLNSELVRPLENGVNNIEKLPQDDDTKVAVSRTQPEKAVENLEKPGIVESSETVTIQNSHSISSNTSEIDSSQIGKDMSSSQISSEMTASQIKAKISTEEEAKAAIAERRRLAKEEAARRAEQERLRIEAEQQAELEKQRQEEEQVRLLIEARRAAEEQRLNEAIMEAKRKEEEEQQRREEEARLKAMKEEADKKAKLDAEKQKAEQQERLIKEEKEREARRKRVEAIMLRTRGKQNSNNQQNSEDSCDKSENKVNGTKPIIDDQNGPNVVKDERVDNIIQENPVKNSNSVSIETINSNTDSINSNNLWQPATQLYGNFVLNNNS